MKPWIVLIVLIVLVPVIRAELCSFDTRGTFYCESGCCETECCEDELALRIRYSLFSIPWALGLCVVTVCLGLHFCTRRTADEAFARGNRNIYVLNRRALAVIRAELCSFDTRGTFYCESGCCETECCEDELALRIRYSLFSIPWALGLCVVTVCLGLHFCTRRTADEAFARGNRNIYVLNRRALADSHSFHGTIAV